MLQKPRAPPTRFTACRILRVGSLAFALVYTTLIRITGEPELIHAADCCDTFFAKPDERAVRSAMTWRGAGCGPDRRWPICQRLWSAGSPITMRWKKAERGVSNHAADGPVIVERQVLATVQKTRGALRLAGLAQPPGPRLGGLPGCRRRPEGCVTAGAGMLEQAGDL